MPPSGLVPNGAKAARPGRVNSELAAKLFQKLQRHRIKFAYGKIKAFKSLTLVLLILTAALSQPPWPPQEPGVYVIDH